MSSNAPVYTPASTGTAWKLRRAILYRDYYDEDNSAGGFVFYAALVAGLERQLAAEEAAE